MTNTTTAQLVRKEGLDKFYTLPHYAQHCINQLGTLYPWDQWSLVIEPSAGNGSFLLRLPVPSVGLDIAPEHPEIVQQDFFHYQPPPSNKILVIGNPPFGRVSSLAVRFFNHAAQWADVIAFIVPRTFRRISIQNKLNPCFHLKYDEDTPTSPPVFAPAMMAKCCFQVWERNSETPRQKTELSTSHEDWVFLSLGPKDARGQPTPPTGAHFAIRAYGGRCGEIRTTGLTELRPKSWHWIKSTIDPATLIARFQTLDYSLSQDTARQNSIGRGELVRLYSSLQEE